MRFFTSIFIALFLLAGCAGTVKPLSKGALENKTITIVPTGQTDYGVVIQSTGALFGALGAIVEYAVTKPSAEATKERVIAAVPPDFLMQIAINQIEIDLKKYGDYKTIISKSHTLKSSPFEEWSKNLNRSDLKGSIDIQGDIILDVGVTNLNMLSSYGSYTTSVGVSIRFINRNSGEMHGEVREIVSSSSLGLNFNFDETSPSYKLFMQDAVEKLVRTAVANALKKIHSGSAGGLVISQKSTQVNFNIPNSYSNKDLPDGLKIQDAVLWKSDNTKDNSLVIYSIETAKILESDNQKYAERRLNDVNGILDVTSESQIKVMTINGLPAWQKETTGILKRGSYKKPITYHQTAYFGENEFILLKLWSPESTYPASKSEFENIAGSISNINPKNAIDTRRQQLTPSKESMPTAKPFITQNPSLKQEIPSGQSNAAKLIELKSLLDQGLINRQDFDAKKSQILKGI